MDELQAGKFLAGGLCGVARRSLGLHVEDAAAHVGKSITTVANFEEGRYRLAPEAEAKLIRLYLVVLHERCGSPLPEEGSSLENLRIQLAQALLVLRAARLAAAASGTEGGTRDLLFGVVKAGLEEHRVATRYRFRMRRLLQEFLEFQQGRFAI